MCWPPQWCWEHTNFHFLIGKVHRLTVVLTDKREASIGFRVWRWRVSSFLTQKELAHLAGVSLKEVDSFEHSLPVSLDSRRRILRELWARKASRVSAQ